MDDQEYDDQTEKMQAFAIALAILAVSYLILKGIGVL
jgi:hypothetical protein